MTARTNPFAATPGLMKPLLDFNAAVEASGLEHSLMNLVKIRASQINGCAICIGMHTAEARKAGETELRIYMLNAWREAKLYSDRERAALDWTEALTRLSQAHPGDEAYAAMAAEFSETEQVNLTLLIGLINSFNRVGVGFHLQPPGAAARQAA